MLFSPSSNLKSPRSNIISPSSTLLPPSSVKRMGCLTQKVLKIAWFPIKCPQAPLAPLAAFSRSAWHPFDSWLRPLCLGISIYLFWNLGWNQSFKLDTEFRMVFGWSINFFQCDGFNLGMLYWHIPQTWYNTMFLSAHQSSFYHLPKIYPST